MPRERLKASQIKEMMDIEKTFNDLVFLDLKEMAILKSKKQFPNTNESRHNRNLSDKAEKAFSELAFLFKYLPPSYKNKILSSENFNEFIGTLLYLDTINENLDDKTKNIVVRVASQLFVNSLAVIKDSMPREFHKPLVYSATPFVDLLKAVLGYGKRNSLKDIPEIHIPNKLLSFAGPI